MSVGCSEVAEKQCTQSGASVLLSVMDHDVLSSNDFAGEVCIGLQTLITGQQRHGMTSSALHPLSLPILNYDAPPATTTGRLYTQHCSQGASQRRGEVCIGLQTLIAGQQIHGMTSSALHPLSLPILNYDAPPTTATGRLYTQHCSQGASGDVCSASHCYW